MSGQTANPSVFFVGDTIDGHLSAGASSLGKQAWSVAKVFSGRPIGVLTGHDIDKTARDWSQAVGMPVVVLDHVQFRYPNPPLSASGIALLLEAVSPAAVCFPHSMRASQAAAAVAWRCAWPCVTAVEGISKEGEEVMLRRSIYGGKLIESVSTGNLPLAFTLMPGAFPEGAASETPEEYPSVDTRHVPGTEERFIPRAMSRQSHADQKLEKAHVVVAVGRGLGEPEQLDFLEQVAEMFQHAAVGGSRGACDLGWLPHSLQIGETGRAVAPALYLACGISGAPQHLAGMRESQTIVAINTDAQAAIRNVAHYAVVEDLKTFLPLLRQRYDETRGH